MIAKKLGINTSIPTNNNGKVLDQKVLNLGYTMMEYREKPHQIRPAEIIQKGGVFNRIQRTIKPANATPYETDLKDESPARLPHSQAQTPKTIEIKT